MNNASVNELILVMKKFLGKSDSIMIHAVQLIIFMWYDISKINPVCIALNVVATDTV